MGVDVDVRSATLFPFSLFALVLHLYGSSAVSVLSSSLILFALWLLSPCFELLILSQLGNSSSTAAQHSFKYCLLNSRKTVDNLRDIRTAVAQGVLCRSSECSIRGAVSAEFDSKQQAAT